MRILMLSKALISGAYQKKCEELAALPGVELTVAVPPSWREPHVGRLPLERRFTTGYQLEVLPIALNGQHHLHFYPTLAGLVGRVRPEIFHVDEESFNLATFLAMRIGVRYGARCCFYNYANIDRFYPPPFNLFERYAFRNAVCALAANQEAAAIIRRHGYSGPIHILPQFGVDPELFAPGKPHTNEIFTLGYLGRLLPQKGLLDLLEALVLLPPNVHLRLVGEGDMRERIIARTRELGLAGRVEIIPWTSDPTAELRRFDTLILPSRTTSTWKEQFGRVLIEAMSCAIPVIGSSSGEIPHVIGEAGMVFPEGDIPALAHAVRRLVAEPVFRAELGMRGRARVLEHYTQAALARQYYALYESMLH